MARSQKKIIFLLVTLFVLVLFNRAHYSPQSKSQENFNRWLADIEQGSSDQAVGSLGTIAIRFSSKSPSFSWELAGDGSDKRAAELLRLLQLMREADIFAHEMLNSSNSELQLMVVDEQQSFSVNLQHRHISKDIAAQTMLRLLRTYAADAPAT